MFSFDSTGLHQGEDCEQLQPLVRHRVEVWMWENLPCPAACIVTIMQVFGSSDRAWDDLAVGLGALGIPRLRSQSERLKKPGGRHKSDFVALRISNQHQLCCKGHRWHGLGTQVFDRATACCIWTLIVRLGVHQRIRHESTRRLGSERPAVAHLTPDAGKKTTFQQMQE